MTSDATAWTSRSVAELCSRVTSGGTPSRSRVEFYHPATIPWVKTGDLDDAPVTHYSEFISESGVAESSAKLLPAGTVLMAMYGATVGKLGLLTEPATCNQASCAMIADPASCDSRWLFYALLNDREMIISRANGAAQQNLSGTTIKTFHFMTPSLSEQQSIAEVLGALDDKIAANTNLAATAEELATAEFHRRVLHVPFSDQTFADLAKVSGGGTPSTAVPEYWNGDVRWATPTDVTGLQGPYLTDTSRRISEAGLNACASELYPAGSILMTSRATIGAFALAREPMAVNQGFIVVQPRNPDLRLWLFHEMRSRIDEFISLANGATFLELSRGNFKKFKVRLADAQVMKEFVALAKPIHEMAANALLENARLSATRDTLLPRLLAGDLQVKEAEKALAEAAV